MVAGLLKILILHDSPLAYEGARTVLAQAGEIEEVREARDGTQALLRCAESPPDVVVVDASLPRNRVAEVIDQLKGLCNEVSCVVIIDGATPYAIRHALLLPVAGFVARESPAEELVDAVRAVASGQHYITPCWAEQLVRIVRHLPDDTYPADAGYEGLSGREREVFRMLVTGMTNKEIAFALQIGRKTVEKHHLRVLRKLGLSDSIDLIRYATRIGVVDLDRWVSS